MQLQIINHFPYHRIVDWCVFRCGFAYYIYKEVRLMFEGMIMCDLVEEYARERAEKVAKEAARKAAKEAEEKAVKVARKSAEKLLQNGVAYDLVRATIDTLSDEELREIYAGVRKR